MFFQFLIFEINIFNKSWIFISWSNDCNRSCWNKCSILFVIFMRNINLEFPILFPVSGLTEGTLSWLITQTLRMVLRHFLPLFVPASEVAALIVTLTQCPECPALPIVRPALTRVVTERINDLPGLTFLLFWFFNLSQCHMHLISIGSPHHSCGGARARVWDKNSSELDSYFSWNKTKDDLQWKTLL